VSVDSIRHRRTIDVSIEVTRLRIILARKMSLSVVYPHLPISRCVASLACRHMVLLTSQSVFLALRFFNCGLFGRRRGFSREGAFGFLWDRAPSTSRPLQFFDP